MPTDPAPHSRACASARSSDTRQLIADTARRLFVERGFEPVTVAEIARAADVAEKTVFNYFPTKEDLFYSGLEAFEEQLLDAIRERAARRDRARRAFGRFVLPAARRARAGSPRRRREATKRLEASPA